MTSYKLVETGADRNWSKDLKKNVICSLFDIWRKGRPVTVTAKALWYQKLDQTSEH